MQLNCNRGPTAIAVRAPNVNTDVTAVPATQNASNVFPITDPVSPSTLRTSINLLVASVAEPARSRRVINPLVVSKIPFLPYLPSDRSFVISGEAVRLVESGRDVDAEAQAILASLPDDETLQGLRNARDTIAWRLEASAHELATVLDERSATQRALDRVDQKLAEFHAAEEEDAGGNWTGGGSGEYEYEEEDDDDANDDDDADEVNEELDA
jgi:hypothetical protein